MKRVGELMKDLGFNPDAPLETQKAFIKHLIRVANAGSPQNSYEKLEQKDSNPQLSFDSEILGPPFKKFAQTKF